MAEMRDPVEDFPSALTGLYLVTPVLYSFVGIGIYCLGGEYTQSSTLETPSLIPAKVVYGVVIPAVLTAALGNGHVGVKYIFIVAMCRMNKLHEVIASIVWSWGTWLIITTAFWVVACILANAILIFDSLLSIQSATTYAWFSFGINSILWFSWNKGNFFNGNKQIALFLLNCGIIGWPLFMIAAGLWASVMAMLDIFASDGGVSGSFSYGDNSAL